MANGMIMATVGDAAARYARAGYFTVIEGIVSPRWFFPPFCQALAEHGFRVAYAILRPSLPIAIQRAQDRPSSRLAEPSVIEQLWHDFANLDEALERHVIDNTQQTAQATTDILDERLLRGALTL